MFGMSRKASPLSAVSLCGRFNERTVYERIFRVGPKALRSRQRVGVMKAAPNETEGEGNMLHWEKPAMLGNFTSLVPSPSSRCAEDDAFTSQGRGGPGSGGAVEM